MFLLYIYIICKLISADLQKHLGVDTIAFTCVPLTSFPHIYMYCGIYRGDLYVKVHIWQTGKLYNNCSSWSRLIWLCLSDIDKYGHSWISENTPPHTNKKTNREMKSRKRIWLKSVSQVKSLGWGQNGSALRYMAWRPGIYVSSGKGYNT